MIMPHTNLLKCAQRLAADAGLSGPHSLHALNGGRNNRVFRVDTADGPPLVLKSYFRDPRDRRAAEWDFLIYARSRGIVGIPEPIATDAEAGVSILGFVKGKRIHVAEVTRAHVMAALDFIEALNPPKFVRNVPTRRYLENVRAASEACFSLQEHVATITRRVARLGILDADVPSRDEAVAFVDRELLPAWQRAEARIAKAVAADPARYDDPVYDCDIIVSPSDFGFHNALVDEDGNVSFLDFEYAGRDDPAKLLCDFFCQPDVPVDPKYFTEFLEQLAGGLCLSDTFRMRATLLLDAYRIKWACIMLNDFLPLGDARRSFANPAQRAERCEQQLARTRAALAIID